MISITDIKPRPLVTGLDQRSFPRASQASPYRPRLRRNITKQNNKLFFSSGLYQVRITTNEHMQKQVGILQIGRYYISLMDEKTQNIHETTEPHNGRPFSSLQTVNLPSDMLPLPPLVLHGHSIVITIDDSPSPHNFFQECRANLCLFLASDRPPDNLLNHNGQ